MLVLYRQQQELHNHTLIILYTDEAIHVNTTMLRFYNETYQCSYVANRLRVVTDHSFFTDNENGVVYDAIIVTK